MVLGNLYLMIMKALFSLPLSLLLPFVSFPALAEEGWEQVRLSLESGEEVVLLPLPSEISSEFLEEQPPPLPELHFSGSQADGTSLAQAMLVLPSLSFGGNGDVTPFLAFKGQDDGTRDLTLSGEGGVILSLGGRIQAKFSWERTIRPFPLNTFMVNASFHF